MLPDHLETGTVLRDTYRVQGRIGRGGMGVVYEVTHARLSGRYALKLLAREATEDAEALRRFQREAEIASSLRHPNIVQVVDFDQTSDGRPYLVMELLEGESLAARLKRQGRLPLAAVVEVVKQIAAGLAAAHARGIVHRDLKPENLFLVRLPGQEQELVKVVDFGISKVKSGSLRLTGERVMLGTPYYMAPEQTSPSAGAQVDERADQFALAAVVYELLCGELAFDGRELVAVVYQVMHHHPPRLVDPAGLAGPAVDQVLLRALAKDPAARFPSISEFARALEAAARDAAPPPVADMRVADTIEEPVRELEPEPPRLTDWWALGGRTTRWTAKRKLGLTLVACAVGAAVVGVVLAARSPDPGAPAAGRGPAPAQTPAAERRAVEAAPSPSPSPSPSAAPSPVPAEAPAPVAAPAPAEAPATPATGAAAAPPVPAPADRDDVQPPAPPRRVRRSAGDAPGSRAGRPSQKAASEERLYNDL
jgi:eukaryotic-like serine/threonine-protein kinase